MDIFRIKLDGESTLEYCLRRANFDCYCYVMNYYVMNSKLIKKENGVTTPIENTPERVFSQFIKICKICIDK